MYTDIDVGKLATHQEFKVMWRCGEYSVYSVHCQT